MDVASLRSLNCNTIAIFSTFSSKGVGFTGLKVYKTAHCPQPSLVCSTPDPKTSGDSPGCCSVLASETQISRSCTLPASRKIPTGSRPRISPMCIRLICI